MPKTQRSTAPKYIALQRVITTRIHNGDYAVGDRIPSEADLAKEAGISRMTVRQGIGELVEAGYLERRQGSGTYVCERHTGRNLALLFFSTRMIAPQSLAWLELEAVRQAAEEEGRDLRAILLVPPIPRVVQLAKELRAMDVGAVGLIGFTQHDRHYISYLPRVVSCVLFNSGIPGLPLPCAKPDMNQAAAQVVEYFASKGRKRIGVMTGRSDLPIESEFLMAMETELHRRGLPVDKSCWYEGTSEPMCPMPGEWISHMLASDDRPDAIVGANRDWMSMIREGLAGREETVGEAMDLAHVIHGVPADGGEVAVPWARVSLEYDNVVRNAQQLLMDAAHGEIGQRAPVLMSETRLIPPGV